MGMIVFYDETDAHDVFILISDEYTRTVDLQLLYY